MSGEEPVQARSTFPFEKVNNAVKEVVNSMLQHSSAYNHTTVNDLIRDITEKTLTDLKALSLNYKLIVTCTIAQKSGGGLHSTTASHWDGSTDGMCTVRWENKSMVCIVNVFGLAY
eukprot:comp21429_c0_seq1/m.29538 comp21429_c0_seq1/g.29538  ORF comp21429_c0_seq1/g.29538 comp21429_c0_seq1/m.29538 type:complete len:116 (-) comp21429_c0_seq1:554-901(-)